jgi:ribonuclease P protein component
MAEAGGAKFPREARLLKPDEFTRVLKTRPFRGKFLWIYRLDHDRTNEPQADAMNRGNDSAAALANAYRGPQLGMMIGKRNAKTAVLRNAIKRRLREEFRLCASHLPARAYMVRLSAPAKKADVPLIRAEWIDSLKFDIKKKSMNRPIELGNPA